MARALAERDWAMEDRARTLAEQAVEAHHGWASRLGAPPSDPSRRERWMWEVSTVAAYRDRWHLTGRRVVDADADAGSIDQKTQRQRAQIAMKRAVAISRIETDQRQSGPVPEVAVEMRRGVER